MSKLRETSHVGIWLEKVTIWYWFSIHLIRTVYWSDLLLGTLNAIYIYIYIYYIIVIRAIIFAIIFMITIAKPLIKTIQKSYLKMLSLKN